MAYQAGIRTLLLPETSVHAGVGNVVNLVRARLEQQAIHDFRHVTVHASAGVGGCGVMRMRADVGRELVVTLKAHAIRIPREF